MVEIETKLKGDLSAGLDGFFDDIKGKILLSGVAALFVVLVPFIDAGRPARGRWLTVLGVITAGYAVGMTAWGYRSLTPVYVVVASVFLLAVLGWVTRQPGRKR